MFRLSTERSYLLIIGTLIASFSLSSLWIAIAYFGVYGAIVFCLVFSFLVTSFSRLLFSWGRSNGLTLLQTFLPPVISLIGSAFVSLGIYQLVVFSQTGVLDRTIFYPWLALLLGGPALYFLPARINRYFIIKNRKRNFIGIRVRINHDVNLPICIDELRFVCSNNGSQLDAPVSIYRDDSSRDKDREYTSLSQRIQYATRSVYFDQLYIPLGTDKIYLSWYSLIEDKYYQSELSLSFDVLPLRRPNTGVLSFNIQPISTVYLSHDSTILCCYTGINENAISVQKKDNLLQRFKNYDQFSVAMVQNLQERDRELYISRLIKREEIQKGAINWCLHFVNLDENNKLEIDDVAHCSYRCKPDDVSIPDIRPLPEKIEFMYQSPAEGLLPWLYIYVDTESLYGMIQKLTGGDKKMPVEFVVTVEDTPDNTIQFIINANGQSLAFNDWETIAKAEYKRKSKKLAKIAQQKKLQYQLLDSAWSDVKNKDYQAAEIKFNELLSNDPEFKQIYFLKAQLIFYTEGAVEYFSKIEGLVEMVRDDKWTLSRLYNSTGCILDEQKRYAEALSYFEKSSLLAPDEGMYLSNIAELHYKLGQAKKAISYVHKAKEKKFESEIMSEILSKNGVMKQ